MPNILALCNFLTGDYQVGGTTYTLADVIQNVASSYPPQVDVNGLAINGGTGGPDYGSGSSPNAHGPFLTEWLGLYNSTGFTCIISYSLYGDVGPTDIVGVDGNGNPAYIELIVQALTATQLAFGGNVILGAYHFAPDVGGRENVAFQVGPVNTSLACNGYPAYSNTSPPFGPNTQPWVQFWVNNASTAANIQWIGLYDSTIDVSWLPILSAPGAAPPLSVPSGPAPGWGPGPFQQAKPGDIVQIECGKFSIDTVASSDMAQGTTIQPFDITIPGDPANNLPIQAGTWTLTTPITEMYGLWHLEGKTVMGLADGQVIGPFTVVDGSVTLPFAATNVVIGLSYSSQLQTLYLDAQGQMNMQGRRKTVPACTLRVANSRGPKIGRTFDDLQEMDDLMVIPGTTPMELVTGDFRAVLFSDWEVTGQVCVQQDYPLPLTVLGIIPEFLRGDTAT